MRAEGEPNPPKVCRFRQPPTAFGSDSARKHRKSAQTDSSSCLPACLPTSSKKEEASRRFTTSQRALITQTHSRCSKKGCACSSQSPRANLRDPITQKKTSSCRTRATHTTTASLQSSKALALSQPTQRWRTEPGNRAGFGSCRARLLAAHFKTVIYLSC